MHMTGRLRGLIADPTESGSIGTSLRRKRWRTFAQIFPNIAEMRVLDLGGTVRHWEVSPVRPASVTVLNLLPEASCLAWVTAVQGDACDPPAALGAERYDLVYSNSVIEHVGGYARRCNFAGVVHDMAPRHWVQTPNVYFPIEPHWLFPGLQFLPQVARAWAIQRWPLSPAKPADSQAALRSVLEIELLSKTELQFYFPTSRILREQVLGMSKSIIAVAS